MLKVTKGRLTIRAYRGIGIDYPGEQDMEVSAYFVVPGLAVHHAAPGINKWTISHVASGLRVSSGFRTMRQAVWGCQLIKGMLPWTNSEDWFMENSRNDYYWRQMQLVRCILRAIREGKTITEIAAMIFEHS